jgi:hypothetical protein
VEVEVEVEVESLFIDKQLQRAIATTQALNRSVDSHDLIGMDREGFSTNI